MTSILKYKNTYLMQVTKKVSLGKLTIDSVKASKYQKAGTLTVQFRQIITTVTTYPSTNVSDGISDNLFAVSEFNVGEGKSYTNTETRIAWINVPDSATIQVLNAKLDALVAAGKTPCIAKTISNSPILSGNQEVAITKGFKTMDDFANSQVVRYGNNHANAGALILDGEGNPMYKRTYFKEDKVEDENTCGMGEVYFSSEIGAELASTVEQDDTIGLF